MRQSAIHGAAAGHTTGDKNFPRQPLAAPENRRYSPRSPLRSGDVGEWLKPTVC